MSINNRFTRWLARGLESYAHRIMDRRGPDFIVGGRDDPYLNRWFVIPRNPIFNVYVHEFRRSDDDRACHCHPWVSVSLALSKPMGETYLDRTKTGDGEVVVEKHRIVRSGDLLFRTAKFAHRMVVHEPGAVTLFITGPRIRAWGFWCDGVRFVPWREFVSDADRGRSGRGCD